MAMFSEANLLTTIASFWERSQISVHHDFLSISPVNGDTGGGHP